MVWRETAQPQWVALSSEFAALTERTGASDFENTPLARQLRCPSFRICAQQETAQTGQGTLTTNLFQRVDIIHR